MCDLRLVDCANFFVQPSNGQTYGLSPVWMRTCVRRLKSSENRFPQPSNVHCIPTNSITASCQQYKALVFRPQHLHLIVIITFVLVINNSGMGLIASKIAEGLFTIQFNYIYFMSHSSGTEMCVWPFHRHTACLGICNNHLVLMQLGGGLASVDHSILWFN